MPSDADSAFSAVKELPRPALKSCFVRVLGGGGVSL
jgi:hypothetical protein